METILASNELDHAALTAAGESLEAVEKEIGENPLIKSSSFGGCESDDVLTAIEFARGLTGEKGGAPLVGQNVGIYGVDLGALAAVAAAVARAAAGQCTPDTGPLDLLADLQRRADDRAGELARIADDARTRGAECASRYDNARALIEAARHAQAR